MGNPDLVILPGTKSVAADLAGLRAAGLEEPIRRHAEQGKWMLGVCGGLQMLGTDILDPLHMESAEERTPGAWPAGLSTTFASAKTLLNVRRASTPLAPPAAGYEIHHGVTRHEGGSVPIMFGKTAPPCGYGKGRIWATYLRHSDGDEFRRAFVPPIHPCTPPMTWTAPGRLADVVREHLDLKAIYRILQLKR